MDFLLAKSAESLISVEFPIYAIAIISAFLLNASLNICNKSKVNLSDIQLREQCSRFEAITTISLCVPILMVLFLYLVTLIAINFMVDITFVSIFVFWFSVVTLFGISIYLLIATYKMTGVNLTIRSPVEIKIRNLKTKD